jgi:ribose transport system permease protein
MISSNHNTPPTLHSSTGWRGLLRQRETGIALAALGMFVILSVATPNFRDTDNLFNVMRQIALLGIVATGMTMLFVAGELDLSVGSMYVLLTIILSHFLIKEGWPILLGVATTLVLGALCGLINAAITTRLKIPAFITTLGTMSVFSGLSLVISGGFPISGLNAPFYKAVTAAYVFGFMPAQIFWLIVVMVVGGIVLARTRFGYQVYATGGNKQAATNVGINVDRIKTICFVITGFLVALSAVIAVGWLRGASPSQSTGFELDVIAAVIIGGTNLYGGSGTIFGTFLGAAISGMIGNGLVLLDVDAYWEPVAKGLVIIAAVALDGWVRTRQARAARGNVLASLKAQKQAQP